MINMLLIDNYDSFTHNLEHLFGQLKGVSVEVVRNDDDFLPALSEGGYDGVIISPGPGNPLDENYFGNCMKVIKDFGANLPILGICLGFQGLSAAFGAELKQAKLPMHGKTSVLKIVNDSPILKDIPNGVEVMRYHSLMVDTGKTLPKDLLILAETNPESQSVRQNGREIMAVQHTQFPIYGLQFHPESFATELGSMVAKNFLDIIKEYKK